MLHMSPSRKLPRRFRSFFPRKLTRKDAQTTAIYLDRAASHLFGGKFLMKNKDKQKCTSQPAPECLYQKTVVPLGA